MCPTVLLAVIEVDGGTEFLPAVSFFLGEGDHYIHEVYEFRVLLLRYCFSRGWRWVGEEVGMSDGRQIDHYSTTGEEAAFEHLTSFGYRGGIRTDRDDTPTGLLKENWGPSFPLAALKAEQLALARHLRTLSEQRVMGTDRMHFFGFDIDAVPGGAYEEIEAILASAPPEAVITDLRRALTRIEGESLDEEIARLKLAIAGVESHQQEISMLLGRNTGWRVLQSVRCLSDSIVFLRDTRSVTNWKSFEAPMQVREEGMFQRIRAHLPGDSKVILHGHAAHLSKGWLSVQQGHPPTVPPYPSVGTRLHQAYPGEVFSIWLLAGQGQDSQPYSAFSQHVRLQRRALNALLAEVGSAFVLLTTSTDPRSKLFSQEMKLSWMFNGVIRAAMARQTDAVFFVRNVTPLHPAPEQRGASC